MGLLTLWGLLMIILALFLLLLRGLDGIYTAFVITAPLFVTFIAAIPLGDTVLRTSYLFAALFIGINVSSQAVKKIKINSNVEDKHERLFFRKDLIPIYSFLLIISVSLFMPFFLQNDVNVISFQSSVGLVDSIEFERLEFRQSNLTQLIYPLFQIILFTCLVTYISSIKKIHRTIDLLIKSSFIIFGTGLLHIILVQLGSLEILSAIKLVTSGAAEFKSSADRGLFGLARMHSWAGEPGYTSFFLLSILGICLASILTRNYSILKNRRRAHLLFAISFIGVVLSTGTTGYVGLVILFSLSFISSYAIPKDQLKINRVLLVVPVFLIFASFILIEFLTGLSLLGYFQEQHISKLTDLSGSGLVRFTIVAHNFQNFLTSPILGLGYGSERSLALSAFLLSNTGLVGYVSFTLFAFLLMKKMWNIITSFSIGSEYRTVALGLFLSFGTMFALMQFAKSETSLLFHYFWIIAACMLALHRIYKSKKNLITKNAFDH
jgi:hypothetical protein